MERQIGESILLPNQLQNAVDPAQRSAAARLMEAILEQTARDIRRFRDARDPVERRLYREACNWVRSSDESHPFAFVPLCEVLGYSPLAVRQKLLPNAKVLPPRASLTSNRLRTATCAAALLLTLLLPLGSRAATLRLPDTAVAVDTAMVVLAVSIDDAIGLEGADITISYDPVSLSIAAQPQATTLSANCLLASNYATPGLVHVSLACSHPLVGGGPLLTLAVQPQRTGTSVVEISRCELNEQSMPCNVKPGSVFVQPEGQPASVNPSSTVAGH
jgi:hypothetical protein